MKLDNYFICSGEKPLDRIVDDGGFAAIFRTICCVGDSLASGEFESTNPEKTQKQYNDYYEYSWGQYMARAMGSTVYNFSKGGMSAKSYWEKYADQKGYWDTDKLCQAYIIALGVNDLIGQNQELGCVGDINFEDYNKNADTFCGYYARIIQRYKEMQPHAKFFLMTMPKSDSLNDPKREAHAKLLHELAEIFDYTYVIDLYQYAPVYNEDFKKAFYLGGHLNPMGYVLTAKMVMSYIDYIIRSAPEDFIQVPFIGKGIHNYTVKW